MIKLQSFSLSDERADKFIYLYMFLCLSIQKYLIHTIGNRMVKNLFKIVYKFGNDARCDEAKTAIVCMSGL